MAGNKFDSEKPRMDLLDYAHIRSIANVLTFGSTKYGDHNWRKGIETHRLFAATMRHLISFWEGVDIDEESGLPHLAHAAADIMMLQAMLVEHPELDTRYKKKP